MVSDPESSHSDQSSPSNTLARKDQTSPFVVAEEGRFISSYEEYGSLTPNSNHSISKSTSESPSTSLNTQFAIKSSSVLGPIGESDAKESIGALFEERIVTV